MENDQVIPYVDSCKHLGNEIRMNRMNVVINNATNDLHCRLNSLLADFFHCDSVILSTFFKTYCMNLYGSQMWRYNDKATRSLRTPTVPRKWLFSSSTSGCITYFKFRDLMLIK